MSKFKECPYCGEEILAKALKCKHCHSMLEEVKQDSKASVEDEQTRAVSPPPPPGNVQRPMTPPPPPGNVQRPGGTPPPPPGNVQRPMTPPPPPGNVQRPTTPPPPPVNQGFAPSPPSPPSPPGGSVHYQSPGVPLQGLGTGAGSPGTVYDYSKAELGKRILAYLIDMFLACVGLFVTAPIAFIPMYRFIISDGWITPSGFQWVLIVLGLIIGFGWALLYSLLRDGFGQGQSIGKKATGLMVVRLTDNLPCTKKDSLVRNVVAVGLGIFLGWIPVINFFAGFAEPIIAIIHQKGMRLGDIVAKTQVIAKGEFQR